MKYLRLDRRTLYQSAVVALTVLCLALIVHEIIGEHGWLALRRQQQEYDILQQQILKLKEENHQLEEQIKALKSDPKAIEKQAREQLHFLRPGETIYTFPERDPKTKPSPGGDKSK